MLDLSESFRKLFKGGSIAIAGVVADMGISFAAKLVSARYLGKTDYGSVSIGVTILGISSVIVLLGLHTGVARYLPRAENDRQRRGVIRSALHIWLPIALVMSALIFTLAGPIATNIFNTPSAAPTIQVFAVGIPIVSFSKLAIGATRGVQLTAPKVIVDNLTIPLVRFSGIAVAFVLGLGAIGVSGGYLVSYVGAALASGYFVWREVPMFDGDYEPCYGKLIQFSLPLLVSGLAGLVYADVDSLVIGYFFTSAPVATYNVIYPLSELVRLSLTGFSFIFMPVFSELHSDNQMEMMKRIYKVITKWGALSMFPVFIGIFIFPSQVISLTFGAKYTAGAVTLSVLTVPFFIHTLFGPNTQALTALGDSQLIMYSNLGLGAMNFLLNLVLVPQYSYLGAAIGTAITYTIMNLVLSSVLYIKYSITPMSMALWKPLIAGALVFSINYVVFFSTYPKSYTFISAFMFINISILFLIIIKFGGIQQEELLLIGEIEERFDINLTRLRTLI